MSKKRICVTFSALHLALLCCVWGCLTQAGCASPSHREATATDGPRLLSLYINGTGQHDVELDGYGTCTQAHWVSQDFDGGLSAANPYVSPAVPASYNQHGSPTAFVRGSTPTLTARFTAPDNALTQAKVVGDVHAEFDLGDAKPVTYRARLSGEARLVDGQWIASDLRCDRSLPDAIGSSSAFTIQWTVTDAQGRASAAGVSSVPMYLLRQTPRERLPLLHTPVALACQAAAGLDTDADILDAVWQTFAKGDVRRARDDMPLAYYGTYHGSAGDLRGLLVSGSGQCTTWAYLMHAALGAQGIDSDITGVFPATKRGRIFVANWAFLEGTKFITSGPNGICETTAAGDDIQAIAVNAGRPNTPSVQAIPAKLPPDALQADDFERFSMIMTGPDGIVQSALDPESFVPVVPLGFGVAQQRGYRVTDPSANIKLKGDDRFSIDAAGTRWVMTGPDGILATLPQPGLESAAAGRVTVSVGKGSAGLNLRTYLHRRQLAHWPRAVNGDDVAHDNAWISTGPNGISQTAAKPGEKQIIPLGNGMPDVPVIGPGPDGVLDTTPGGDDELLDQSDLFKLAGEGFPYLPGVNMWPLAGAAGQQASNPPPDFPNHVILRVGKVLYDPSYGTGPFANHAEWERASLVAVGANITDKDGKFIGRMKARRTPPLSSTTKLLAPD